MKHKKIPRVFFIKKKKRRKILNLLKALFLRCFRAASKFPLILYFRDARVRVCARVWQDNCRSSVKRKCLSHCCSRETGSGDVGSSRRSPRFPPFHAFYKCRIACTSLSYLMTQWLSSPSQRSSIFISAVNKITRPFLTNINRITRGHGGGEKREKGRMDNFRINATQQRDN